MSYGNFSVTVPIPTPSDPQAVVETTLASFKAKFATHFALAIPPAVWQAILAAISSILGGCITPTPASVKANVGGLYVQFQLRRNLLREGVSRAGLVAAMDAATATIKDTPDADLLVLIAANTEAA